MTVATNTTTANVPTAQEAGDTLVVTAVQTSVTELLPQEAHGVSLLVDFGHGSDVARTTVTGQPWVKATSRLVAQFAGDSDDHDAEDSLVAGLRVKACNPVAGVGFDVIAHSPAPGGATGKYTVHVVGV